MSNFQKGSFSRDFRANLKVPKEELKVNNNPTSSTSDIKEEVREAKDKLFVEFSQLVKGTCNENLIAFYDPKVRELLNFVVATLLSENVTLNPPDETFTLNVPFRYKSLDSFSKKIEDYKSREVDRPITDFFAMKIVSTNQSNEVLSSHGDKALKEIIKERELYRNKIIEFTDDLSINPDNETEMTLTEYCDRCNKIFGLLKDMLTTLPGKEAKDCPDYASERKAFYDSQMEKLKILVESETNFDKSQGLSDVDDIEDKEPLTDLIKRSGIDIMRFDNELSEIVQSKVNFYQLSKAVDNIFNNSYKLQGLGISISIDHNRTKYKRTPSGYFADFKGLNLTIPLEDGTNLILPFELQIQTAEQLKDGITGYSYHGKVSDKDSGVDEELQHYVRLLKNHPKKNTESYRLIRKSFMEKVLRKFPECYTASISMTDWDPTRVEISQTEFYKVIRENNMIPQDALEYEAFSDFLRSLYGERKAILPPSIPNIYITPKLDIPNPTNLQEFRKYMSSVSKSVSKTMQKGLNGIGLSEGNDIDAEIEY